MVSPSRSLLFAAALLVPSVAMGALSFNVAFTAQAMSDLGQAERDLVQDAMDFWDAVIDGHRDGIDRSWTLTVSTFSQAASGGGIALGSAGVSGLGWSGIVGDSHTSNGLFLISTAGNASFNVHPDAGPLDPYLLRHEIGHALGIGTLWQDNEIYNSGGAIASNRVLLGGTPGQLVGPATLAAYQAEFDPTATYVPVELDGGAGAAHAHWNEVLDHWNIENTPGFDSDPGDGSAAPVDVNGTSFDDVLMSGVKSGSGQISLTTLGNLQDLGFTLHPVPEPGTLSLLAASLLVLARRKRI